LIYDAKVQKILETTKHFRKFFHKKYTKGTVLFVYSTLGMPPMRKLTDATQETLANARM